MDGRRFEILAIGGCTDTTNEDGIVTTPADFEVRAGVEIATVLGGRRRGAR